MDLSNIILLIFIGVVFLILGTGFILLLCEPKSYRLCRLDDRVKNDDLLRKKLDGPHYVEGQYTVLVIENYWENSFTITITDKPIVRWAARYLAHRCNAHVRMYSSDKIIGSTVRDRDQVKRYAPYIKYYLDSK